ncbi:hypothetical protein [Rhizobium sp. RAF56]|uniref:hypothetical protein n=1 Tax=Rhizobium sp. RAF56 TaxID=3233062 RepID=UPI003F96DA62
MLTILAHHDVKDVKHWLASPRRKKIFEPIGCTNIRTFVDPQASKRVGLVMDVADIGRVTEFMKTKAAADAMEYDGMLTETLVILTQS